MKRYRLGTVPYLNAKPLVHYFEHNPRPDVTLVAEVPSRLAERLRAGMLDAALVSSVVCLGDDAFDIVPGLSIAADGAVDSIRLFCREEPGKVRRVALDGSSRTAATLTRVLFAESFHAEPEYVVLPPDLERMLAEADAALLIGDPAMRAFHAPVRRPNVRCVLDLGEVWHDLTGLPFVYAVWAAGRDADIDGLAVLLGEAREAGRPHLDAMADDAAARLGIPVSVCRNYLRRVMLYDLGPRELDGLRRFGELATRHGLLPAG